MEEVFSHIPSRVDAEMNARLNRPYNKEEVKEALFQMFPTKALGWTDSRRTSFRGIGIYVGKGLRI